MKQTRREFLVSCGALALAPTRLASPPDEPLVSSSDLRFLRALASATIASATKPESVPSLGFAAVTPGGNYPAMWIRDFSMAAGCGLIPESTLLNHIRLIASAQSGPSPRKLGNRALIPPYAIPDHINYDGRPVFYPGTYSSGDDQGGEPYGVLPPIDDHFEFIHVAYLLWKRSKSGEFLGQMVAGKTLSERLTFALACPAVDAETGLVITRDEERAVGFGFCDGIYLTGSLLFASLLRYRALDEMIQMVKGKEVATWRAERMRIGNCLGPTFAHKGWLKAATGVGQQPDVWGTIYALYIGAVPRQDEARLRRTLVNAVRSGTITYRGAVRHVPTDHDFSATSAWERTAGEPLNRYQNGAYWHVPTGWLAKVLWKEDRGLARQVVKEMITHFRNDDFRLGEGHGAPWECLHPDQDYRQNPIYMASVTLPLEAITSKP